MFKNSHYYFRELLIWCLFPILFLCIYISKSHAPIDAVTAHLYVVALMATFTLTFSALVFKILPKKIASTTITIVYGSIFYTVLIYYFLVIIGINSWGKVITVELIQSYARHPQQLCESIGLSYGFSLGALIFGYVFAIAAFHLLFKRHHRVDNIIISSEASGLIHGLIMCLLLFFSYHLYDYFLSTETSSREPFRLTLYSAKIRSKPLNSIGTVYGNSALNPIDDDMRKQYSLGINALKKNVILIVVDALRPDNMGVYGYDRNTTPFLNSLEKENRIAKFNNARASCSESACGLASLASARYMHQFSSNPFKLQDVLKRYDYDIHMVLGGDHTNFYNLRESYGKVDSYFDASMASNYYINDDSLVIDKLNSLPPWNGRAMMMQIHLMSAHTMGKRLEKFEKFLPSKNYTNVALNAPGSPQFNHYDNGVFQADTMIAESLRLLQIKNYLKDAIIIVTADHGEGLGEHGLFTHGNSVYEEALRIPLLLIDFERTPALVSSSANFISQVDIAPTILHELQMPAPKNWSGQAIQLGSVRSKEDNGFTFFQTFPFVGFYHRADTTVWKYWINTGTDAEYAFNLSLDPKETNNLVWQIPLEQRSNWRRLALSTQSQR